jgi:hypothetical protein
VCHSHRLSCPRLLVCRITSGRDFSIDFDAILSFECRQMPPTMTTRVDNVFGADGDQRNNRSDDATDETQEAGLTTSKLASTPLKVLQSFLTTLVLDVCGIGFIACRASDEFRSQFKILYWNRALGGNGPGGPRGGHEDLQWVRTRRNGIFSARWEGATMSSICTGSGEVGLRLQDAVRSSFFHHGESSRLPELPVIWEVMRDARCEDAEEMGCGLAISQS